MTADMDTVRILLGIGLLVALGIGWLLWRMAR